MKLIRIFPLILWALILYYAFYGWQQGPNESAARPPQDSYIEQSTTSSLTSDEVRTISLFDNASPSVVYITTINIALQRNMFSLTPLEIPRGTGTGFVWDSRGYIVTNFHVLNGSEKFKVRLSDQSDWDATFVGAEPDKDVAVLKIDAPARVLKAIPLGSSQNLKVGQKVLAIGNPFGLDQTLTTGVISGLGREIVSATGRPIQGVIQTDAAINPGNSGGPLLDSSGKMIGVNTAIFSPSGAYAGVGFAVPVDTIKRLVPQIVQFGKAKKAGIGVEVVDDWISRRLGITRGVMIGAIAPESPAKKAGLQGTQVDNFRRVTKLGDIIVQIDKFEIADNEALYRALDSYSVGDTVTISFVRNGKEKKQTVLQLADIS